MNAYPKRNEGNKGWKRAEKRVEGAFAEHFGGRFSEHRGPFWDVKHPGKDEASRIDATAAEIHRDKAVRRTDEWQENLGLVDFVIGPLVRATFSAWVAHIEADVPPLDPFILHPALDSLIGCGGAAPPDFLFEAEAGEVVSIKLVQGFPGWPDNVFGAEFAKRLEAGVRPEIAIELKSFSAKAIGTREDGLPWIKPVGYAARYGGPSYKKQDLDKLVNALKNSGVAYLMFIAAGGDYGDNCTKTDAVDGDMLYALVSLDELLRFGVPVPELDATYHEPAYVFPWERLTGPRWRRLRDAKGHALGLLQPCIARPEFDFGRTERTARVLLTHIKSEGESDTLNDVLRDVLAADGSEEQPTNDQLEAIYVLTTALNLDRWPRVSTRKRAVIVIKTLLSRIEQDPVAMKRLAKLVPSLSPQPSPEAMGLKRNPALAGAVSLICNEREREVR